MFGMLSPARHSLAYRATYARCCQHHRRVHGVSALPWLSYEAVLLFQVAVDARTVRADLPQVRCCKLLPTARSDDRVIGAFCAHVGSLLASIKVADDVRDRGSLRARLLGWMYRRRFAATRSYFARLEPAFARRVEGFIAEHLALENSSSEIALVDYVRPTARAFGYVFSLMARLPGMGDRGDLLRQLGERVGSAIIAFDCAVDRDRDRRRGDFNPLADGPAAVAEALAFSRDQLALARSLCETAFGPSALTTQTLAGVGERVANVGKRIACPRCGPEMRRLLQGWGLERPRGAVQFNSLLGLGGLAALAVGLALKLMASAPPPLDPNAVTGQSPPPPLVPPPASGTTGGADAAGCGASGAECCCEGSSCAVDNACDGLNCSGCEGGGCDGCSGCDVSC